jgi:DNA repair exonuclease SbcCD ATPase subunit
MTRHLKGSLLFLCAFSFNSMASTQCDALTGCEKKFCEIEYQIKKAEQYDNQYKVERLTTALKAAKENCTNEGLKDDLREKIKSNEQDLAEYQADLEEAKRDDRADKIRKYEGKIEKELRKIDKLKQELAKIP